MKIGDFMIARSGSLAGTGRGNFEDAIRQANRAALEDRERRYVVIVLASVDVQFATHTETGHEHVYQFNQPEGDRLEDSNDRHMGGKTTCPRCSGKGYVPHLWQPEDCPDCKGTGFIE